MTEISVAKEFGVSFEEKIIQCILADDKFAEQIVEVLEAEYFELESAKQISKIIKEYYFKYNAFPSIELINSICKQEVSNKVLLTLCEKYLLKIQTTPLNGDSQWVKDNSLNYFKTQHLRNVLITDVLPKIKAANFEEIVPIIERAVSKGTDKNVGYDYNADKELRFTEEYISVIPTPWKYLNDLLNGGWGAGRLATIIGAAGCHAKDTKILMYDGYIKNVQDIKIGDKLMGPDSKPRNVLQLYQGRQKMYEIQPIKGEAFVVNEDHILSLQKSYAENKTDPDIINISVKNYLNANNNLKRKYKLYRTAIDFQNPKELLIEPYIMGLLLGDGYFGHKTRYPTIQFTTIDNILAEQFINFGKKLGLSTTCLTKQNTEAKCYYYTNDYKQNNPVINELIHFGLQHKKSGDKFIPYDYLFCSKENRLQLLAGLLDTDGYYNNGGFEITTKSLRLKNNILFLARSLGFAAYSSIKYVDYCDTDYHRIYISGDCSIIPTKLPRKQAKPREQIKDVLRTGFKVVQKEIDDYYGFNLDGDNLYVMGDFTVTHNSGKSMMLINVGVGALKAGKTVIHYTLELSDIDVARRYDANLTDVEINHVVKNKEIILTSLKKVLPPSARLIIKEYPMKGATIQTIRSHLARLKLLEIVPDVIIIDYWDLLKSTEFHKESRHSLEAIGRDQKALAQELKIPVITATQTNRTGYNSDLITPDQISEDFSKVMTADIILTMARNMEQKKCGLGKAYLAKNRQGEDGQIFAYEINTKKAKINCIPLTEEIQKKFDEMKEKSDKDKVESELKDGDKILKRYNKKE